MIPDRAIQTPNARRLLRPLAMTVGFGLLSLAVGRIQFQIPGVQGAVSDLREVVVLISALYLPHWGWCLGVAAITSLATPSDGSILSTLVSHAAGVVAAWHVLRFMLRRWTSELAIGLASLAFVLVYYYGIVLPLMVLVYPLVGLIEPGALVETFQSITSVIRYEVAATAGITASLIVAHSVRTNRQRVLEAAYDDTLEGWARALELRDRETEGHTRRVTELTVQLGRAFGLSHSELRWLRRGAILHDIGKMGVPDHILLKAGAPTEEEWAVLRQHPDHARRLLEPIEFLRPALDIPTAHHERWDGSGYPLGLAGEDIPFAARLFAVADVWDALASDRPYRDAWDRARIVAYLREHAGGQFDPRVVEVFLRDVVGEGPLAEAR